jgi:Tfp pilus assembly protein PilP
MRTLSAIIGACLLPAAILAQAPAQPPLPPPGEGFAYDPEGRRDPFLNLLAAGTDTKLSAQRPEGIAGLTTAEVSVRGVVSSRGALVAMVQGPDNRTHIVRQGDKLLDGTVKAVTPDGLIIVQDVTDPLSLVKQREVRRLLRSVEAGKE